MMMRTFPKEEIKSGRLKILGMKDEEIRNDTIKQNEISFLDNLKFIPNQYEIRFISLLMKKGKHQSETSIRINP